MLDCLDGEVELYQKEYEKNVLGCAGEKWFRKGICPVSRCTLLRETGIGNEDF